MKKSFLVALSLCSFFSLANAQTIKVGTEATFAPFEFTDEKSNIVGYDVDIIKAIAKAEGFEVEVVNQPFDALIPGVLTGQLDGAIAGITITEQRAKQVAFSDPYYKAGINAVIRKEDAAKYPNLASLKDVRLCAQIGTTGASVAKKLSKKVGEFNTVPDAFMELNTKGCEAVVNDRPVNLYFLATKNDDAFVEIPELYNGEEYGIILSKKNPELLKKLNSGLKKIRQDGTFNQIHQKWFKTAE